MSLLLLAQDDAIDPAAEARERARRAWFLAKRVEEADSLPRFARRPSLFDQPIPDRVVGLCLYPGCNRKKRKQSTSISALCDAHAKQLQRRGAWTLLTDIEPVGTSNRCKRGHSNWYTKADGGRRCLECVRIRNRAAYAAKKEARR